MTTESPPRAARSGQAVREYLRLKLLKYYKKFFSSREEYASYKRLLKVARHNARYAQQAERNRGTLRASCASRAGDDLSFRHSGNAGDIIYALPAIRELARGRRATLLLQLDMPAIYWEGTHPLGRVSLNRQMADCLLPLLTAQSYLNEVAIYDGRPVDYDLDEFRGLIAQDRGHIPRWYFNVYGLSADLAQPWIEVSPMETDSRAIVIARSHRYRNVDLDYRFLRQCGDLRFVGTPAEFDDFRRLVPDVQYMPCANFLELAQVIASSRFFIGNQSFPYSLAEAIKVPRVLEVCPWAVNVIPHGANAYEAGFQETFERAVARLMAHTAPG